MTRQEFKTVLKTIKSVYDENPMVFSFMFFEDNEDKTLHNTAEGKLTDIASHICKNMEKSKQTTKSIDLAIKEYLADKSNRSHRLTEEDIRASEEFLEKIKKQINDE